MFQFPPLDPGRFGELLARRAPRGRRRRDLRVGQRDAQGRLATVGPLLEGRARGGLGSAKETRGTESGGDKDVRSVGHETGDGPIRILWGTHEEATSRPQ